MAVNEDYLSFIEDQMSAFAPFVSKKMFGGIGFFKEGIMFGMIGGNIFRLRVDETNKNDFEEHGIKNGYLADAKKKGMPYWEVPIAIVEDKDELIHWLTKAYAISVKAKKK